MSAGQLTQTIAAMWVRIPATAPATFGVRSGIRTHAHICGPPLPALTPNRSPPRPRSWPPLTLTPRAWSALAPDRDPPWPTILARLDLLWASTQKFQAGIVQYNQFTVDAGISDTKCRRSRLWDSNPHRCDCLSQPSSTQPTAPREYSGGEADRVWPGAYHTSMKRASPAHGGRWLAQTNYDALMTHHTTENIYTSACDARSAASSAARNRNSWGIRRVS